MHSAAVTRRVRTLATIGLLLLLPPAGGCIAWPGRKVPLDAASGFYQQASLTYRLDAGKLQQPLDVARVEGQTVTYDQIASSPLPDQSIGTLTITYPHPAGRTGLALAQFTLESNRAKPKASTSWNPFKKRTTAIEHGVEPVAAITTYQPEVHEAWTLDLPSADTDQLFKLLASHGFYQNERPDAAGVQLSVNINGAKAQKNWDQIAELNALIQRIRRTGQLTAYNRPNTTTDWKHGLIASPHTNNNLATNAAEATAAAQANPFAMLPSSTPVPAIASLPVNTR